MSFIGNMLGINQGGAYAPKAAPVINPITGEQTAADQAGTNSALAAQNAFMASLGNSGVGYQNAAAGSQQGLLGQQQAQGAVGAQGANIAGMGNLQNQIGAGTGAQTSLDVLRNQQALAGQMQGVNGVGNQASVFDQLQGVANGKGPNPAQAMLAQSTGQNVANQAALMASQRGTGANTGLLARQAAMQGAATQQQAAGQGATLQANQSLNAMNQLGGIAQNQIGNQLGANAAAGNTAGNIVNQGLNSAQVQGGLTNAAVGQQQQSIAGLGGLGSTQVNQEQAARDAVTNAALANKGQNLGATAAANSANVGMQSNINNANVPLAAANQSAIGSGLSAIGGGMAFIGSMGGKAAGVPDPNSLSSGMSPQGSPGAMGAGEVGATGGTDLGGGFNGGTMAAEGGYVGKSAAGKHLHMITTKMAKGGSTHKVPALVSPGEKYLNPKEVAKVAAGKKAAIKAGEKIPGKPKVGGAKNSYANDTVHKNLDEGGIVLPRSVTQSKDPAKAAHAFVSAILARKGMK